MGNEIELYDYYQEKETLLTPERKSRIDNVLTPLYEAIIIACLKVKAFIISINYEYDINKIKYDNDDIIKIKLLFLAF